MSSVTGCFSTEILSPACGSSIFGAEMSMPGIGPATVALSGEELLLAEHAASEMAAALTTMIEAVRNITFTTDKRLETYSAMHADMRNTPIGSKILEL